MVVVAILVVLVAGIGFFLYKKTGGETEANSKTMPMPKAASEGMARMMQNRQGGPGAPGAPGGPGAPAPR